MAWYHYHQLALVVAAAASRVLWSRAWRSVSYRDALVRLTAGAPEQLAVGNKTALPQTEQNYLKKKKGVFLYSYSLRGYGYNEKRVRVKREFAMWSKGHLSVRRLYGDIDEADALRDRSPKRGARVGRKGFPVPSSFHAA